VSLQAEPGRGRPHATGQARGTCQFPQGAGIPGLPEASQALLDTARGQPWMVSAETSDAVFTHVPGRGNRTGLSGVRAGG